MAATPRSIDAGVGIGEIFLDKYRIEAILGHGGMGVVALCTHMALNERVAIKMLRRDVLDDAEAVERFMREAQAASKLRSEYVARVTDVGRAPNNVPYMVMEYLAGHDLGDLIDQRGSIGLPWAIELTLQACEALAEAHSIGIVHRDIKPTNLFVTWRPDGSALIKVLDFGISKSPVASPSQLTQTQSLLGTPAYMSPEQMRSARLVDARSDIWSLGTVLYELLEGRRPFEAVSFSEMCVKVAVDPPAPMTKTPTDLQHVVLRCLAKAPEQRYSSMAELGAELVPFSHDPHQAQVLAERMARTLRRSQIIDWDPANSGPVDLRRSGEQAIIALSASPAPALAVASNPALPVNQLAEAAAAAASGSGSAPAASDASPPFALTGAAAEAVRDGQKLTSSTLAVARPIRPKTVLILTAVTAAAAIGVVISLMQSSGPLPPAAPMHAIAPAKPIAVDPPAVEPSAAEPPAPAAGSAEATTASPTSGETVHAAAPPHPAAPSLAASPSRARTVPVAAQPPRPPAPASASHDECNVWGDAHPAQSDACRKPKAKP